MVGLSEALTLCLFGSLVCVGAALAGKHAHSMLAGAGWGVIAWLAAMSAYFLLLIIYDWFKRGKSANNPNDQAGVIWFVVCLWGTFFISVPLTIVIARRLFF